MVYSVGCKRIISFFVYSCVIIVLSFFRVDATECNLVKTEFETLTGAVKIVPDSPVYDSELSVCFTADPHKPSKSCCTSAMEGQYMKSANSFIKGQIRSSNAKLKTLVVDNMKKYQDAVLSILQIAENNTALLLTDIYSIPWEMHHGMLSHFFINLKQFVKRHPVGIKASVNQFFDKLFPLLFQYSLSDPSGVTIDKKYRKCLEDKRRYFTPMPFADFPTRLFKVLNKVLSMSKIYLDALSVIVEAINTTDSITIEKDCKKALTRLQYCSQCGGHLNDKPCKGFCLNVMRGCLAKIAEISPEWDEVMNSVESFARNMKGSNNVEKLIRDVDSLISDALLHSLEIGPKLYERALFECGQLNISKGNLSLNNGTLIGKRVSTVSPDLDMDLHEHVMSLGKQLGASTGIYNRFADDICEQSIYEQSKHANCWNGSHIASYNREVPEADFISQAKSNAEVKVSLIPEETLLHLKDKLSDLRRTVRAKIIDSRTEGYQSDSYNTGYSISYSSGYGSGSKNYPDIGTTDDEDVTTYHSGSGSGEKPHIPDKIKPHFTVRPQKPGDDDDDDDDLTVTLTTRKPPSSGHHTHASLLMLLICSIVNLLLKQRHF